MTTGGINAIKSRLITLIREADTSLGTTEANTHVFGDWRIAMNKIYSPKTGPKLPIVTVRISPAMLQDKFFGRLWNNGEYGEVGMYSFTAHCFAEVCTTSGEEKYKNAHDLADSILRYLASRKWHQSPHSSYPIWDIGDLNARESQPKKGGHKVCRVIIEGNIMIKRTD